MLAHPWQSVLLILTDRGSMLDLLTDLIVASAVVFVTAAFWTLGTAE